MLGRVRAPAAGEEGHEAVVELAFRGTVNVDNWITNLKIAAVPCPFGPGIGQVHLGFLSAYESLRQRVMDNVHDGLRALGVQPSSRVLVQTTGHSLGGALATLAAYDLASSWCCPTVCVTFGAPRVGDSDFAKSYGSVVGRSLRFVNKFDPVPKLPPSDLDSVSNDADMLHHGLGKLLGTATTQLGAAGYVHAVPPTQLDEDLATSMEHWTSVATAAGVAEFGGKAPPNGRVDQDALLPHFGHVYERKMEELMSGDRTRARAKAIGQTINVAASLLKGVGALAAARGDGAAAAQGAAPAAPAAASRGMRAAPKRRGQPAAAGGGWGNLLAAVGTAIAVKMAEKPQQGKEAESAGRA